jgi:hypothetical protein
MATLSSEQLTRFHRRYFLNDCERRFRLLDVDCTNLLGLENLQHALVDMFPTLKLELKKDGHHIQGLPIQSLIKTFDSDGDGCLDFDDFVKFVKFQEAWRAQFFSSESPGPDTANPSLSKSSSLPQLAERRKSGSASGKRPRTRKKVAAAGRLDEALAFAADPKSSKEYLCPGQEQFGKSSTSRCTSSASTRCSSRSGLDSSRGSFYSSFMGMPTSSMIP